MFTWTGPGEVKSQRRPKKQQVQHESANSGSLSHSDTGSMTESHQSGQSHQSMNSKSEGSKSEQSVLQKKIDDLEKMRKHFYDYNFPFPPMTRTIGWVVLVLWSSGAVLTAIVYGLSFDITPEIMGANKANENYALFESDCWNTSLQLRIEDQLSQGNFTAAVDAAEELNEGSFGGSDTSSWL